MMGVMDSRMIACRYRRALQVNGASPHLVAMLFYRRPLWRALADAVKARKFAVAHRNLVDRLSNADWQRYIEAVREDARRYIKP